MSQTENIKSNLKMPEFTIDSVYNERGQLVSMGIKRMLDIAHALKDSVMLWGAPGVGKSQGVMQWNAEKVVEYNDKIVKGEHVKPWNPEVCDVRLSMKEPVDMIGVPIPTTVDGKTVTVWAIPSMWPKDDGQYSGGTILLDEMNQGQAAILNAAFQLIQDRRLGDYKVPEGYVIIGASNPSVYNGTVTEFSVPLSNRFSHFNIKTNFEGWINYRLNHGGNTDVMTFLKTQDQGLLFDEENMKKRVGVDNLSEALYTDIVVTPRSWEVVERLLSLPEGTKEDGGFTFEEKSWYATGRLGVVLKNNLFNYIKDKDKFQSWQDILENGNPFKTEDVNFWRTNYNCVSAINNCNDDTKCREYVLKYIEALRKLTKTPLKTVSMGYLTSSQRLKGRMSIFNPMRDAKDLCFLIGEMTN